MKSRNGQFKHRPDPSLESSGQANYKKAEVNGEGAPAVYNTRVSTIVALIHWVSVDGLS